jgi:hypothetical protein
MNDIEIHIFGGINSYSYKMIKGKEVLSQHSANGNIEISNSNGSIELKYDSRQLQIPIKSKFKLITISNNLTITYKNY